MRGGGHNPAGHCVCDGGLVIDLSLMRGVEVDGEARIARAEGGATWLDFDAATQAFGLVTPRRRRRLDRRVRAHPRRRHRPPDRAARPHVRQPRRRRARHPGRDGGPRAAPTRTPICSGGCAAEAATSASRRSSSSACIRSSGSSAVASRTPARASREALRRFRDVVGHALRATSAARRVLDVDESLAPVLVVAPCYTGSDADPEELRALRSAPGLVDDGVREHRSSTSSACSTRPTARTATTGRATSCASSRTS